MSISTTANRANYTGTSLVNVYAYTFKILDDDDLRVTVRDLAGAETTLAKTTHYTVSGVNATGGGNVTLVAGFGWMTGGFLTTGYKLTIRRVVSLVQETDIRNQGEYFPELHEDSFDRTVMIDQQQQDELNRSIKASETETVTLNPLPDAATRASQFIGFDISGQIIVGQPTGVPASAFAQTLLDDASALEARSTLGAIVGVWPTSVGGTGQNSTATFPASGTVPSITPANHGVIVSGPAAIATVLGAGAARQFLKSGGAAANPSFQDFLLTVLLRSVNYTLTNTEDSVHFTTGASNLTATLPTAALFSGKRFTISKVDAGSGMVSLATTSGQTINGLASGVIKLGTTFDSITVESNDTNWIIVNFDVGVFAKANTCGTSFTGGGTVTAVFATEESDSWSAYDNATGIFTCPVPGFYQASSFIQANVATGRSLNDIISLRLAKNGLPTFVMGQFVSQVTSALTNALGGSGLVNCLAGDTLRVEINNPSSTFVGNSTSLATWVSFLRVGQ